MPIRQWVYLDNLEALPPAPLPEDEVAPYCLDASAGAGSVHPNARYDGQVMVFGRTMQRMLQAQSAFLVGAGAIGCEMLKNWALMGVACNGGGG
jgi:ubiquitin-activating enzyme E1